jgi:hypothetical protein
MTNLEALSAACNYPIETVKLQKILIDNGLNDSDDYVGTSQAFELATAALYVLLVTSATISEGDFSVSASEKTNLINLAGGIYVKYGIANPLKPQATIQNRSNYW